VTIHSLVQFIIQTRLSLAICVFVFVVCLRLPANVVGFRAVLASGTFAGKLKKRRIS